VNQTFVPRYYEIEQALRARIARLEPDEPLPSDAQLCEEFGVSRMTARNAVQRLVQEGLVYRLPGRGTFVADYGSHRHVSHLTSFTDEMRRHGRVPSSKVLERTQRPGTPVEARRLRIEDGAEVVVVRRIRLADDEPVAIEQAVLREDAADAVLAADLESGSLHATLREAELVPTSGRATIGSEPAQGEDARLLGVQKGWPLLVERRVILDQNGAPLETTETRYAAGRYALDVEFVVERPDGSRPETA
jgi:GntR family transcriptional regulator